MLALATEKKLLPTIKIINKVFLTKISQNTIGGCLILPQIHAQ
jgi:hypothetical protein